MSNLTTTTNGMKALKSSFNANVDLFAQIGSARGTDMTNLFRKAFKEDANLAIRNLLWVRDVRGGAGERQTFRTLLNLLVREQDRDIASRVVAKIPELGRWDDMFDIIGIHEQIDAFILETVAKALVEKNGLCAKWMPREGKKHSKFFMEGFGLTPRQYRKLLVGLTNVVEQKMCARQWDSIEFGKIPSIAAKNYQKAFQRNAPVAYENYVAGLATGESKINAGAIFPYDVIRGLNGVQGVADAQWKALPDYLEGSAENLLCVVDVSGSMGAAASPNLTCMDVAVSLGIYVSERSKGIFQDKFITFDERPSFVDLSGCKNLSARVEKTRSAPWGGSTNLEATFKLILNTAMKYGVRQEDMPTKVLIFSDMQFNNIGGYRDNTDWTKPTAFQMIDAMYANAGYTRPEIIFWNLNARYGNLPVSFGAGGTAMVTGFSPAIMKSILAATEIPEVTPLSMMLDTIGVERYDW
jgi:hypothetical protein